MWLYKLTNNVDRKAYVGTSVNPISHRISRHLYAAKTGRKDMAIACAIRKYGLAKFSVECLGQSDNYDELLKMETAAIKSHNTLSPHGYNLTTGGRGARRKCSDVTKALISKRAKDSFANGRIPWNLGVKVGETMSKETRAKVSAGLRGKPSWNKGIPATAEHRRKLLGRTPWNKGTKTGPMSEEQKLRIAATMRKVRSERFWTSR
jgi:group I intron endonuclease